MTPRELIMRSEQRAIEQLAEERRAIEQLAEAIARDLAVHGGGS